MNKCKQRIVIVLICIFVLLNSLQVQVYAVEKENVTIYLGQYDDSTGRTELTQYKVIKCQNDFLFSGEDIAFLTGYEYWVNGKNATFSRGAKTITINIEKGILQAPGIVSPVKLENQIVSENGILYYSGAYLFPWLNVTCFEDAGILYIVPDMVSVWDFINEFEQEKQSLLFDFELCCQQLKVDSKWLKVSSYVKSNMIHGGVKDRIWIPFTSHSYGAYRDYYDIFEELFEQKTSMLGTFEEIVNEGKKINAAFSFIDKIDRDADIPDEYEIFRAAGKVLSGASKALEWAIYFHSFYQDNREKLMWMDSISGNRENYDYPEAMIHAAFDIKTVYTNQWEGVELKIIQKLTDGVIDKLVDKVTGKVIADVILKGIGGYEEFVPDWNEGISDIGYYNELASCGINVYEASDKAGLTDIYDIEQRRAHACLYLYSCGKNWETMADYAKEEGYNQISEEYTQKADRAFEWMAKFIASSCATVNDSFKYSDGRMKEKYTEELISIFSKLRVNSTILDYDVKDLNLYLSFFLNYRLGEYSSDNPDYITLLQFAFSYIQRENQEKLIKEEGYNEYFIVSKSDIDELLDIYFGITIPEESIGDCLYQDGKFYCLASGYGDIGSPVAILDELEIDEDGNYIVTFYDVYVYYDDFETGEINPTDWDDYYSYNINQIYEDKFCEVQGKGKCVLKWENNRFILLEYKPIDKDLTYNVMSKSEILDYIQQKLPEIYSYANYISTASSGQATLALWTQEELQEVIDSMGMKHFAYGVYVGEEWDDHFVNWDWFYIDKETLQVFWYNSSENIVYELDEWRQSSYYRY